MTLPQAVAEALRLTRGGARVVTVEIERGTVQYRLIKDKQSEQHYRVERREMVVSSWQAWATSPGFDVDDVLGEWQVRAVTGKDSLYL